MKKVKIVCIIDDDSIYRFTVQKYIEMLKLAEQVQSYGDGEAAMEALKANINQEDKLPDIILLDVNMPIMDGWDFIEEFSQLHPSLPKKVHVYMVTSSIDSRDKERASRISEISDFVIKPITEEQLIEIIKIKE